MVHVASFRFVVSTQEFKNGANGLTWPVCRVRGKRWQCILSQSHLFLESNALINYGYRKGADSASINTNILAEVLSRPCVDISMTQGLSEQRFHVGHKMDKDKGLLSRAVDSDRRSRYHASSRMSFPGAELRRILTW